MTADRDIERLLDTWLTDGPMQVSDHAFDEAVGRVHRQRQRPAWRLLWKEPRMSAPLKAVLGAAAVLVVVVAGFMMFGRSNQSGIGIGAPPATPSPTLMSSPTASPPPLPAGRLEARDYIARALPDDPMAFVVTAPEGWSGFGGWAMSGPRGHGGPDGSGLVFMHDPQVVNDPCGAEGAAPSGAPTDPSVDDLVAALSAHSGVNVTGVTDTELAGYSGKLVDLQLPRDLPCSAYYVFAEPQGFYAQGLSNRWRISILDVDGETAVVVLTDYAQTSAQDSAAAQAVLDSLRIVR
jgi:hypothetical protein